ncbi:MAG: hypothetical protein AAB668_02380 [Patescibacteria group bacterium]
MRNFFSLVFVCLFANGCYLSHGREDASETPPGPLPELCPTEASDPDVTIDDVSAVDLTVEAGTAGVSPIGYVIRQRSGDDVEIAEFPVTFRALSGSLTTSDGRPAITNIRLETDRRTLYGPEDVSAGADLEYETLLWDANMLRAHDDFPFYLIFDVTDTAEGTFEVTLGDECHLTPRMWYVAADGDTRDMPIEEIGNNRPITVRVTVTSRPRRFRFCEPWAGSDAPSDVVEAMGYRGCCVDDGEFNRSDTLEPGTFVKGSGHSVYYITADGGRYVFPSTHHLASWHVHSSSGRFGWDPSSCARVVQVPDDLLASVPLSGNAPMRPGLVTTGIYTLEPRYVVDHGSVLRPMSDSTIDPHLAEPWLEGRHILTPDAIFGHFTIGAFVTADYDGERIYREATLEGEIRATYGW